MGRASFVCEITISAAVWSYISKHFLAHIYAVITVQMVHGSRRWTTAITTLSHKTLGTQIESLHTSTSHCAQKRNPMGWGWGALLFHPGSCSPRQFHTFSSYIRRIRISIVLALALASACCLTLSLNNLTEPFNATLVFIFISSVVPLQCQFH